MSEIKIAVISLLAFMPYFMTPGQLFAQKADTAANSNAAFELSAQPKHIIAYSHKPICLKVILRNVSKHAAYIRLWTWPTPFGPHTDLHCMMLRCRNQKTGKEVSYTWPPPGKTVADAQGKEFPVEVPRGKFITTPYDLREFCVLPPGRYVLEFQYDTRFVPAWIKPDKRAWHGITNKVTVKLQVLK